MKCPVCGTPDLLMTERQGVEIDYCPSCRGVWLDRGELDKLIERTDGVPEMSGRAAQASRVSFERGGHDSRDRRRDDDSREHHAAHHDHDDRRSAYDRPRKKKSLFEMFDFD